jgi:predicted dehydrogenase
MKFLIIGLGSMGNRRIRNLQSLGFTAIAGFDLREDRRDAVAKKYEVPTYSTLNFALEKFNPNIFVISTPPTEHMKYAFMGFELGINCFIEASVVEQERILELAEMVNSSNLVIVPSCTMRYFSGPRKVKELVKSGAIGKILNFNYHTGQYLPDWHPWESIESYYVSQRETGGAREIVPFELTWLNDIFGEPTPLGCFKRKLTDLKVDIDDIYHILLQYGDGITANITVDVISRPKSTRMMRILGSEGQIIFNGEQNIVQYINTDMKEWVEIQLEDVTIEKGYINPEEPYIDEMRDFIAAIKCNDKTIFPNSLSNDYLVLRTLNLLEKFSIVAS